MQDNTYWTKQNVTQKEVDMYRHVQQLGIVNIPEFISYSNGNMVTKAINSLNVADMYTDDATKVDSDVFDSIRSMIKIMYCNGIVYPDITGYNFISHQGKVWIVDFEHAHRIGERDEDPFVKDFIYGKKRVEWNSTFL